MPRPILNAKEKNERKKLLERIRKAKIYSDPVLREEHLRKDRERLARRRAAGLIPARSQMTAYARRIVQIKNRISARAYYQRKKAKANDARNNQTSVSVNDVTESLPKNRDIKPDISQESIRPYSPRLQNVRCKDEDAGASLKLNDIWNYFEEEGGEARCVVCRENMSTEYEELKAHLKENHPKLLLQLMQDKDDSDCGSNNADDNNTYTEVVYLEQEEDEPKDKVKSVPKAIRRKRERRCSTPDDVPLKQKKSEENDELSVFIKYITCLLKKLTPEAFSQVQLDIINTILRASSNASTSFSLDNSSHFNKERPASSFPNIIINDVQSGISTPLAKYTNTVAPKDGEQANS